MSVLEVEADRLIDESEGVPETEREGFFDRTCAGNPELRLIIDRALHGEPDLALIEEVKEGMAAEVEVATTPRPGLRVLDRYVIEPDPADRDRALQVGRGGMGVVYAARDVRFSDSAHTVRRAVKMIAVPAFGPAASEGFKTEALVLAYLNDPAFVTVYDVGEWGRRPLVVMELVGERTTTVETRPGQFAVEVQVSSGRSVSIPVAQPKEPRCLTLADRPSVPLPPRDAAELVETLAGAVALAHHLRHPIVHGDLKPANILLADRRLKIADFGIARFLDPTADSEKAVRVALPVGTPRFMAPEQWAGREVGPAADVFALGVILYELLAGVGPWDGAIDRGQPDGPLPTAVREARTTLQVEFARTIAPPVPLLTRVRSTPPELVYIVGKCLAHDVGECLDHDPEKRYPTARELATDLLRFRRHESVGPTGGLRRTTLLVRRHPVRTAALVAAAVLFAGVAGVAVRDEQKAIQESITRLKDVPPADVPAVAADLRARGWPARLLLDRAIEYETWTDPRSVRLVLPRLSAAVPPPKCFALLVSPDVPAADYFLLCRELQANHIRTSGLTSLVQPDPDTRLRAAGLRATLDPDSTWDDDTLAFCARRLAARPSAEIDDWAALFRPIRVSLRPLLEKLYRDATAVPLARQSALAVLVCMWADDPNGWAELWYLADPDHVPIVWAAGPGDAGERAAAIVKRLPAINAATEPEQDRQARALAKGHLALARLRGTAELVAPLRFTSDPRVRTYLTHDLRAAGVNPAAVLAEVERQAAPGGDPSALQALLLSLGEFPVEDPALPEAAVRRVVRPLLGRRDDPGVWAAARWLLQTRAEATKDRVMHAEIQAVNEALPGWRERNGSRIVRCANVHVMAVIPRPPGGVVTCGDAQPDATANKDEWQVDDDDQRSVDSQHPIRDTVLLARARSLRRVEVPHGFAIATHETTMAQFKSFMGWYQAWSFMPFSSRLPAVVWKPTPSYFPTDDCPAGAVAWTAAALYCRWLTEKEFGPDEKNQCYLLEQPFETDASIGQRIPVRGPLRIVAAHDFHDRPGYRLPTEAEWEYAARAGTTTRRHFGNDRTLLPKYGHFILNSPYGTQPVGRHCPNEFGLFDTLGNVFEWCEYDRSADDEGRLALEFFNYRNVRGGSYFSKPGAARSAYRTSFLRWEANNIFGFRIVRTMPEDGA